MGDIGEAIFKAVGILIDKKIESVKFDTTITATVVDDSAAKDGRYLVLANGTKFTAYSTETRYRDNDVVMVTIPQGNYDNQKMIIGKYVDNANTPLIQDFPFDSLIDLTNNLIVNNESISFIANSEDKKWGINEIFNPEEEAWITISSEQTQQKVFFQGYDMIGIRAQFSTWLGEYLVYAGNYGLALRVTFQTELVDDEDVPITFDKIITLDSDSFFGDIYNFESYFTQEGVYDISAFSQYPIVGLELFPYQRDNFEGRYLYDRAEITEDFSPITDNIFIKDPYICLGMSKDSFVKDTAKIICENLDYTKSGYFEVDDENISSSSIETRNANNKKVISLQWVHKDDDTGRIKMLGKEELPEGYEIRWYRYKLGEPSPDEFAGAHWQRLYGLMLWPAADTGEWIYSESPYYVKKEEGDQYPENSTYYIKTGEDTYEPENAEEPEEEWPPAEVEEPEEETEPQDLYYKYEDVTTNELFITFQPNVNNQEEKIKAIVLKQIPNNSEVFYEAIATSNVLTFINKEDVRNQATILDMNALAIRYEDEEKGHYYIYNRAGEINSDKHNEIRTLTAVFDPNQFDVNQKSDLTDFASIRWEFPIGDTMIVPMVSSGGSYIQYSSNTDFNDKVQVQYTIRKTLIHQYTNNTVKLTVVKDGQEYTAEAQMRFGTAGTSGSDYTLFIEWIRDENNPQGNAINLSKVGNTNTFLYNSAVNDDGEEIIEGTGNTTELKGNIYLMDQEGNLVDIPGDSIIEADWYVAEFGENEVKQKEKENSDFYYPVIYSATERFCNNLYNGSEPSESDYNPEYNYQPGNQNFYNFMYDSDQVVDYYQYNISNKQFEKFTDAIPNTNVEAFFKQHQFYRKKLPTESSKNKLEFRPVILENVINEETGNPIYTKDNINSVEWNVNENKKEYYYGKQKYYIKFNDTYILDPWPDYQEVETYYEPIEAKERVYNVPAERISLDIERKASQEDAIADKIILTAYESITMNSVWVLRLKLTNFGDYDLVALFPIALKDGEEKTQQGQIAKQVNYIDGPTFVRYSCDGETDFNKNPYGIDSFGFGYEETGFKYELTEDTEVQEGKTYYSLSGETYTEITDQNYVIDVQNLPYERKSISWKIICPDDSNNIVNASSIVNDNFLPSLQVNDYGDILLNPASIYIPEYRPYAVQCLYGDDPVWTQAILVYEDNYPSTTLNKWNGKDIVTDEKAGTITANGFSAGKKERDNTFTGVVIGDWSRSDIDTAVAKNTGIYGFNHGSMSYAFKDDGTGFIGKDGKGRIFLDGNKSQIFSSNWANSSTAQGMLLDIDDGYIKMQSSMPSFQELNFNTAQWYISRGSTAIYYQEGNNYEPNNNADFDSSKTYYFYTGQEEKYITLGANQKTYPLAIGTDKSVASRRFRVSWDGTAYIQDGQFDGTVNATRLQTENGQIGGWNITAGTLQSGKTTLDSTAGITTNTLTLLNNNISGYIGIIPGSGGIWNAATGDWSSSGTLCIGIRTSKSIVLETSTKDDNELNGGVIRLSGSGDTNCDAIYLKADKIQFTAPATAQFGIYARFA